MIRNRKSGILIAMIVVGMMLSGAFPIGMALAQPNNDSQVQTLDSGLPPYSVLMEKLREFNEKNGIDLNSPYTLRTPDNDNDLDNATALTIPVSGQTGDVSWIQGQDDDRQDYYKFDLVRGDVATVKVTSSNEWMDQQNGYYTFLLFTIFNPDKFGIGGDLAATQLIPDLPGTVEAGAPFDGTYYLRILPYLYSSQAGGFVAIYGKASYSIDITKTSGNDGNMDNNNRPSEGVDATSGSYSGSDSLNDTYDALDFYRLGSFTISGSTSKKVEVTVTPDSHGHMSAVLLMEDNGDYLSSFSSAPPDGNYSMGHAEQLAFVLERSGTYYIMVSSAGTDTLQASYDISITVSDYTSADGDGYYDTAQTITLTNNQFTTTDSLQHNPEWTALDYHDFYRIDNVPTGWNLSAKVTMSNPYSQSNPDGQDYDVYLITSDKVAVAAGATINNPEEAWKVVENGGTFYIMVEAYGGEGSYTLDVRLINPNAVPPTISNAMATPSSVPADGMTQFLITANVVDSDGTVSGVSVDLSPIGGTTVPMVDDGSNGDATPNDNVYTTTATVAPGTNLGPVTLTISATDNDGAQSTGTVSLTVLRWNHRPEVVGGAPTTYTINEDETDNGLDLTTVFTDQDTGDSLTYSWTSTTPEDHHLSIIISNTGKVTITPEKDWNGQETITFKATDTENAYVNHNITIVVDPANDPPEIDKINILNTGKITTPDGKTFSANEKEWFNFTLIGVDVDLDMEGDTLTWSVDIDTAFPGLTDYSTSDDPLHQEKFNVSLRPRQEDVGEHQITATLKDNAGSKDTVTFTIRVDNVNDPPRIVSIEDDKGNSYPVEDPETPIEFKVKENGWLNLTVNAEDDDPEDNGQLRFSTDSSYITFTSSSDNTISFHPTSNMINTYDVTLKVKDPSFAMGTAKIKVIVENKNDPPVAVISKPSDGDVFTTDDEVEFDATGSGPGGNDADYGDTITYIWYANDKPIAGSQGKATFTHKFDEAGDYVIRLEVEDGGDNGVNKLKATAEVTITIKEGSGSGGGGGTGGGDDSGTGGGGGTGGGTGGSVSVPADPTSPTTMAVTISITEKSIEYKDNGDSYEVTYTVKGKVSGADVSSIIVMTYGTSGWTAIKSASGDVITAKPLSDGTFTYKATTNVPKSDFTKGATQMAVVAFDTSGKWNSQTTSVTPKEASSSTTSENASGIMSYLWIIALVLILIVVIVVVLLVVKKKKNEELPEYQEGIAPAEGQAAPQPPVGGDVYAQQAYGEYGAEQQPQYAQEGAAYGAEGQAYGEYGAEQQPQYGQEGAAYSAEGGEYGAAAPAAAGETAGVPAVPEGAAPAPQEAAVPAEPAAPQQPVEQQYYQQPQPQQQQMTPEVQAEVMRKQQMIQQQYYQQQQQQAYGYGAAATGRCPYCGTPVQPGWFICPTCRRPLQ